MFFPWVNLKGGEQVEQAAAQGGQSGSNHSKNNYDQYVQNLSW